MYSFANGRNCQGRNIRCKYYIDLGFHLSKTHLEGGNYYKMYAGKLLFSNCLRIAVTSTLNTFRDTEVGTVC